MPKSFFEIPLKFNSSIHQGRMFIVKYPSNKPKNFLYLLKSIDLNMRNLNKNLYFARVFSYLKRFGFKLKKMYTKRKNIFIYLCSIPPFLKEIGMYCIRTKNRIFIHFNSNMKEKLVSKELFVFSDLKKVFLCTRTTSFLNGLVCVNL